MSGGLWQNDAPGGEREAPQFDTSVAHIARVYNYWLGGKDNYAADREAGDETLQGYPDMLSSVRANRAFLRRAVRYLAAEAGIRQFLDIGTGLPSADNTHEVAQAVAPSSRVVYVDNDPVVLAHARALLTSETEGATGYLDADARDVERILAEAAKLLDFSQPVGVMLVAVLQFIEDHEDPYQLVARLVEAVPPGSFVTITHPPSDMQRLAPGLAQALAKLSQTMAQRVTPRSREQVTRFFDGLDLIEPGVVPIQQWRPDSDLEAAARAGMWGGVGKKP
ncbi:MAG TPA: SAM-dependent methyltransferase [Trebonia sp.]|nr:SAM-dependent methyltransferase [Trebonia sp.]